MRTKKVKIQFCIDMVVDLPEYYTKDEVEFLYNESSFCKNNLLNKLNTLYNDESEICLCPYAKIKFIEDIK